MNFESVIFLLSVLTIAVLVVLNFLIWLRPELLIRKPQDGVMLFSGVATVLAISLFLSCFMVGLWISILKLQGRLGIYL